MTSAPGIPEIRLHGAVPTSGLHRLARGDPDGFGPPYWAYHWGGGLALARHVIDHPQLVQGRRVVDLGTGSGIVAIAAALSGASRILAVDIDPYAVTAARLNAALNGTDIAIMRADMLAGPVPATDLILAGDFYYDEALAPRVSPFLERCVDGGIEVLIGDPWRAPLPRDRLEKIADHLVRETGGATREAAVFRFLNRRSA
ncbi:class I SAM-dependent methyltransferase [Sphingobium sp. CCH11-B1]|uniref:class I SAM-dependent methyltransferase n=1 Tax=Sphingobium sp. CCH11-B1 TaxID=1768781 RepID=UPI000B03671B|nr:50S ribosomal protein L11 methyltransferase [Sphingobium sp. CCH11-B1]MEA3389993.1 50S ribosomal protein L11 methyltransferase [Pseudomonadota bacterium]